MRAKQSNELFIWGCLLDKEAQTVIVMPAPHGDYKSGISYGDAFAAGEIYAKLRRNTGADLRTPELLGDDICGNLILIGGKKTNPVAKHFQALKHASLSCELDHGVIYDKEKQVVLTPEYAHGQERTLANVVADYGLIVLTDNPFGKSTKILQIAGIRGFGTLAAAIAVVDPVPCHQIDKLLARLISDRAAPQLKNRTVEIQVKTAVTNGKIQRESIQIEKITVRNGVASRTWESETYKQLNTVVPHRLYITATKTPSQTLRIRARIDDQEIEFGKSTDRLNAFYFLAKQAKEDYLNQSENKGWLSAMELAERLWQIKHRSGVTEIPGEIKREICEVIKRWASHLQRQGKLILSDDIKLDHEYINSEILVFDLDIKKRIVDLVHMINREEKRKYGPGFQLIECKPGLGYRINLHPALIFITEATEAVLTAQSKPH
jgi:hypothetical protein